MKADEASFPKSSVLKIKEGKYLKNITDKNTALKYSTRTFNLMSNAVPQRKKNPFSLGLLNDYFKKENWYT